MNMHMQRTYVYAKRTNKAILMFKHWDSEKQGR